MQNITFSVYIADQSFTPVPNGTHRSTIKIPVLFLGDFYFTYPLYITNTT